MQLLLKKLSVNKSF
jgi:hypothetical protein